MCHEFFVTDVIIHSIKFDKIPNLRKLIEFFIKLYEEVKYILHILKRQMDFDFLWVLIFANSMFSFLKS